MAFKPSFQRQESQDFLFISLFVFSCKTSHCQLYQLKQGARCPLNLLKKKILPFSPANSMGGVWDQWKDGSINLLSYLHCCGLAKMGNYICRGTAVWVSRCVNRQHMSALELKAVSYLRMTYICDSKTVNTFAIVCYCKSILTGLLSKHPVLDFSIFRH